MRERYRQVRSLEIFLSIRQKTAEASVLALILSFAPYGFFIAHYISMR